MCSLIGITQVSAWSLHGQRHDRLYVSGSKDDNCFSLASPVLAIATWSPSPFESVRVSPGSHHVLNVARSMTGACMGMRIYARATTALLMCRCHKFWGLHEIGDPGSPISLWFWRPLHEIRDPIKNAHALGDRLLNGLQSYSTSYCQTVAQSFIL